MMEQLSLEWIKDPFNRRDVEWDANLTRLIDALEHWCKNSGIKNYGIGHTQIALSLTFSEGKDAMLFKLRWHNAKTT